MSSLGMGKVYLNIGHVIGNVLIGQIIFIAKVFRANRNLSGKTQYEIGYRTLKSASHLIIWNGLLILLFAKKLSL